MSLILSSALGTLLSSFCVALPSLGVKAFLPCLTVPYFVLFGFCHLQAPPPFFSDRRQNWGGSGRGRRRAWEEWRKGELVGVYYMRNNLFSIKNK